MRPTDNLNAGGAPPFPYVLSRTEPGSVVKPGAVEFAPGFRNPEMHQAVVPWKRLPGHVELTASAMVSLGRRLPISIDTNFDPAVNPRTITYAVVDGTGKGPHQEPRRSRFPSMLPGPRPPRRTGTAGRLNPATSRLPRS
jgi:hypothetical protein